MAEVIMMCGRICSGKSTYAKRLSREKNAVILSVDEITLALFLRVPAKCWIPMWKGQSSFYTGSHWK